MWLVHGQLPIPWYALILSHGKLNSEESEKSRFSLLTISKAAKQVDASVQHSRKAFAGSEWVSLALHSWTNPMEPAYIESFNPESPSR